MSKTETQIGGTHYKDLAIQPVTFITANKLSFLEGCVVKRMCRHRRKNGIEDLRKAIHEIELMIELEYGNKPVKNVQTGEVIYIERIDLDPDIRQKIQKSIDELKRLDQEPDWHNPENVTQEQLGEGYRFLVPWEVDTKMRCSVYMNHATGYTWESANHDKPYKDWTYRVPASTPIPPKP